MKATIKPWLILFVAVFSWNLNAEERPIRFQRLSIESGLSQSTINCLIQDKKGFLWFGTEDGLNKFDGYIFKIYRPLPNNSNSLSNNSIWALYEDREGMIWIATYNGLNKFDPQSEKFTRYLPDPDDPASLSHRYVRAILEDRNGTLWIGTDYGGISRFDRGKEKFVHYRNNPKDPQSLSSDRVLALYEDRTGGFWVGTNNGLNKFDRTSGKFIRYNKKTADPSSLSDDTVNAVFEDKQGVLWIGTGNGLNRLDATSGSFVHYNNVPADPGSLSHNDVRSIFEDHLGNLWIGTDLGLNKLDRSTESFRRYHYDPDDIQSLSSDSVRALFEDRAGSLWIGTFGGGINKLDYGTKEFVHYRKNAANANSLNNEMVVSLYEDENGILWIGTYGGGLNRFDRAANRFTAYLHDPSNPGSISSDRIRKIYEDRNGVFWIGTYGGGLESFDPVKGLFVHYQNKPDDAASISDNRIRAIYEDRSGILWIGTDGGGLNAFDRQSRTFTRYRYDSADPNSLSHDRVFSIVEDSRGHLWIGTFGGGLEEFIPREKKFIHYRNDPNRSNVLSHDYVVCLYKDSQDQLWIGTDGGGLNKYDTEKDVFTVYTDADGLPNNTIYAILEDSQGNLWMSHNRGISKFDPKTKQFKNYNQKDDLQGDEFNGNSCFKSLRTGEMFFGGVNGFNAFFPQNIKDNPNVPSIVITNFQISNQTVPVGEGSDGRILLKKTISETELIDLSYRDNVFSFEYTALNFISSEKNQYAYKMEGFEKNWNYVGNRRYVSYTSLPPGKYVFKVKGSNNDGIWNEKGTAIRIIIHPPFWWTWWFYLLLASAVGASVFGAFKWRIRALQEKKKELEQLVALRTQELKEASLNDPLTGLRNRRFITEVLSNDISAFIKYKNYILKNKVNRNGESIDHVFGIYIVDIDHFKHVNDTYGHEAGDRILVQLSKLLKGSVRQDDIIVRFGGEEFLTVLKKTDPAYIPLFAEKIRSKVEANPFTISGDGKTIYKTCSVGYVSFPFYEKDPDIMSFEKTVMLADMALYYAKEHGRNRAIGIKPTAKMPPEDQIDILLSSIDYAQKNNLIIVSGEIQDKE